MSPEELEGSELEFSELELEERFTLVELVHRVLDKGVVVSGDAVVSVAGVDLLYLGLRVVLGSVESLRRTSGPPPEP